MAVERTRTTADKHDRIIDAAIAVFAEKGFHHARISDVAARAEVADGTIYLYFRNKDDLLITIFEEKMGMLIDGLRRALDGVDCPLDRIRTFARYHFTQVKEHEALAEVLQIELRLSNKFLKEYRPTQLWEYLHVFAEILQEGQARGLIRALDPFASMWAFFGALDEIAMQWVLANKERRQRFSLDASAEAVADIFVRGVAVDPAAVPVTPFPGEPVSPDL